MAAATADEDGAAPEEGSGRAAWYPNGAGSGSAAGSKALTPKWDAVGLRLRLASRTRMQERGSDEQVDV